MKFATAIELQATHDKLYYYLHKRGVKPQFYRLDNKISVETKNILEQSFQAT